MERERQPQNFWYRIVPPVAAVLAIMAVVPVLLAGPGSRLGLWHFRTGFSLLRFGGWCAGAAILAAVAGAIVALRGKSYRGVIVSVAAAACSLAVIALPVSWKAAAQRLPRIHDITTDTNNPPRFVAVLPLRPSGANPVAYGGTEVAMKQVQAYPDIKTVVLDLPQDQAFARALDTARSMGWNIVAEVPAEGRIEATDTTFWFGFTDDIVIRVAGAGGRSLVDIRSLSRVGVSDVGTNARRIRSYIRALAR